MWILGLKGLKGGEVTTTTVFWRFFFYIPLYPCQGKGGGCRPLNPPLDLPLDYMMD